jgi:hypothetical protein
MIEIREDDFYEFSIKLDGTKGDASKRNKV